MDISQLDIPSIFEHIREECCDIFYHKLGDYGPTWLYYRPISMCDQLWIKIRRIHTLEMTGVNQVDEGREPEFIGLINYAVIMLMKIRHPEVFPDADTVIADTSLADRLDRDTATRYFREMLGEITELLARKNHDYGNAWAEMHPFSITDQITIKIARIRNILGNHGRVTVSENIDAQLMDIVNYSIFALVHLRYGDGI